MLMFCIRGRWKRIGGEDEIWKGRVRKGESPYGGGELTFRAWEPKGERSLDLTSPVIVSAIPDP